MFSYPGYQRGAPFGHVGLAKMSDVKGSSFPMNVVVARRSFVEKNRDTVKRFQQGLSKGVYQFMNSKDRGLAVLSKWLQVSKTLRAVEETYNYFAKSFSFPTRVSMKACAMPWRSSPSSAPLGQSRYEHRQVF